jgi:hypothetical protein
MKARIFRYSTRALDRAGPEKGTKVLNNPDNECPLGKSGF